MPARRSAVESLEPRRLFAGGGLVANFGNGGVVLVPGGQSAPTPGGGLVYYDQTTDPQAPRLVRLLADGEPDLTFGDGGAVPRPARADGYNLASLTVLTDDAVLVQFGTFYGADQTLVVRFAADGAIDTAFGTGGVLTLAGEHAPLMPTPSGGFLIDTTLDVDTAGAAATAGLARYTAAGTLDPTFGSGGVVATPAQAPVAVTADGGFVAEGDEYLYRYTAAGVADPTFGTDGVVDLGAVLGRASVTSKRPVLGSVEVLSDGSLLVASSSSYSNPHYSSGLTKVDPDGVATAPVEVDVPPDDALTEPTALPGGGFIIVYPTVAKVGTQSADAYSATRYTAAGQVDPAFGSAGTATRVLPGVIFPSDGLIGSNGISTMATADGDVFVQAGDVAYEVATGGTGPSTAPVVAGLTPTIVTDTLGPQTLANGEVDGVIRLTLTNTTAVVERGPVMVAVEVVAGDGLTPTPLATVRRPAEVAPGRSSAVSIPVRVPSSLAVGEYEVRVVATDAAGATAEAAAPVLAVVNPASVFKVFVSHLTSTRVRPGGTVGVRVTAVAVAGGPFDVTNSAGAGSFTVAVVPAAAYDAAVGLQGNVVAAAAIATPIKTSRTRLPRTKRDDLYFKIGAARLPRPLTAGQYDVIAELRLGPGTPLVTSQAVVVTVT